MSDDAGGALCGFIICSTIGIVVLSLATDEYIDSKDDYNKYMNTQGVIMQTSHGAYQCFEQTGCNKCLNGSEYDLCETMLQNGITGHCNQNITECCSEKCFNCKGGTCHQCGRKSPECTDNCYCGDINDSPQCMIISGTCYQASLTVNFMTNFGYRTNVSMVKNCGLNKNGCNRQINNCLIQPQGINCKDNPIRIEQIKVGDTVGVIYDLNDLTKLMIGYRGEFTMSDTVKDRFIVGGVFSFIIACVVLILIGIILFYMFYFTGNCCIVCCLKCGQCCSRYHKRRAEKKEVNNMLKRQKKLQKETKRQKELQKENTKIHEEQEKAFRKEQKAIGKTQREEERASKKKEKEKKREAERVKKELNGNAKGWFSSLLERLFSKPEPPAYVIPTAPPLTGPQLESNINSSDCPVSNCQLPRYDDVSPTKYLITEAGLNEFDKKQEIHL